MDGLLRAGEGCAFGEMLRDVFRGYHDEAAGEGYVAVYDSHAVMALLRPELYDFIPCRARVDADRLPGQTFFEEDPAGGFFTLEIRDGDALKKAMLDCLFPEKRKS